jgi:hypothetical protein
LHGVLSAVEVVILLSSCGANGATPLESTFRPRALAQGFQVVILLHVLDFLVGLGNGLLQQGDGPLGAVFLRLRTEGLIQAIGS